MKAVTSLRRRAGFTAFLVATLVPALTSAEEITFGGYTWTIRSGHGGPGPNAWDARNVWLDSATNLHLKIANRDGIWSCAEVTMRKRLGFGRYQFQTTGPLDRLDDQVVLGLFNYPTSDVGPDATHEIDIEFARWGEPRNPIGNFTVWPVEPGLKQVSKAFPFVPASDAATHRFAWHPDRVVFQSLNGHRQDNEQLLAEWTYRPPAPARWISQQPMPVHINLWLFQGRPPKDGREVEVIIRDFKYTSVESEHVSSGAATVIACPLKHGQWEPFPPLTDEFASGRLDESKWFPNNPGWLGRQPGYFNPKNVRVADGRLHLDAKKESLPNLPDGYHTYTTAFVKGKTKVRYGYFEMRARAMDSQASSAFWFYDITPEIWSEIDVFEIGARPQPANYYMNTHLFHTLVETVHWHKSRIWQAAYHLAQEFHVYGFEWDPDLLRFTVDGKVVREELNTHWHQPLALCFDSETFPGWFGLPTDDALPATFSIDYIRAWKRKDGPPDDRPEAVEFTFPGRTTAAETEHRLKVEEGGVLVVTARGGAERPERIHLEYVNDDFFAAATAPEIQKKLTVHDQEGGGLSLLITWSKTEPWKRAGREGAGEAAGSPTAPRRGYHAVGVEVRPVIARPRGTTEVCSFPTESGSPIRVTIRH